MPSEQEGTAHVIAPAGPEQTPLVQSLEAAHGLPSGHDAAHDPPQSTASSLPFFTPSVQLGDAQVPLWQTLLWQSAPPPQVLPTAQR